MTPPEAVPRPVRAPPTGVSQIDAAAAEAMQLGPAPAVRITERVDRPTGTWTLTLAASSQSIVDRERRLFARLVFTALGVAVAVAGVGLVILRQQRRAATLEGRLHYAQELASALVRAEKLITVGVLSAGIAHEIGSPLAVIRGRAEQVRRRDAEGAFAEDLGTMIRHVDHISSTIRQLLDFSRRQPIERRAVPLGSAVARTAELIQWKLDAKSLQLSVELDEGLPALAADPDQLQQVLVNLLLNACDASNPKATIRLAARLTGTRGSTGEPVVAIEIIDQGCGIAPEHMNAVFDPFFTTKKRGDGTGLGLSIASSIVRNHGGEIALTSTHGKGTTVTMSWPSDTQMQVEHA
jgi:signal transduction histidine kinase